MDKALETSLGSKPFVKGLLCADANGLLIAAKGELQGAPAGRYCAIARQASSMCPDQAPPTVLIETASRNVVVRDYDNMVVVLRCEREEGK